MRERLWVPIRFAAVAESGHKHPFHIIQTFLGFSTSPATRPTQRKPTTWMSM